MMLVLAEILIQVGPDRGYAHARTEPLFVFMRRHLAAVGTPHQCVECQKFSQLELVLSHRLTQNPANRDAVQNALDRVTAVKPTS